MRISEGRIMQAKDEVISRDWKRVEEAGSSWKQEWAWHIRGGIWKAVWPEQSEKGTQRRRGNHRGPGPRVCRASCTIVRTLAMGLQSALIFACFSSGSLWVLPLFIRLPVTGFRVHPKAMWSYPQWIIPIETLFPNEVTFWGPDGREFQTVGWEGLSSPLWTGARFQTGWVLSVREREGPEMIPSNLSSWKQDFSTYPEGKVGGGAGFQWTWGRVSSAHSEVRPLVIQVKMSSQQVDLTASLDAFMNLPVPFHVE